MCYPKQEEGRNKFNLGNNAPSVFNDMKWKLYTENDNIEGERGMVAEVYKM